MADRQPSKLVAGVVILLISQLIVGFVWGSTISNRTTVVETRQQDVREDIKAMQTKLDLILLEVSK